MKQTHAQNIINSAIATATAEILTLPICTIKTNYQNTDGRTIYSTCQTIYRRNGVSGFYNASFPAIASQIISTSSKYFFYKYLEGENYRYSNKILNGMMSGIMSSLITHPIDTVKIHYQMDKPLLPEIRRHGIRLFYRGYSKSFGKACLGSSLFFPIYDYINNQIHTPVVASLLSAIISTTIIQPMDYLKTRHIYGLPLYQGFKFGVYYKGLSLNLMRIVPHFMIVMTTIDYLQRKSF